MGKRAPLVRAVQASEVAGRRRRASHQQLASATIGSCPASKGTRGQRRGEEEYEEGPTRAVRHLKMV